MSHNNQSNSHIANINQSSPVLSKFNTQIAINSPVIFIESASDEKEYLDRHVVG